MAVPSWGVGTGGTRFARFPNPGEPRNIFEKLEDCEAILKLVRTTPGISLHIPWDKPDHPAELRVLRPGARPLLRLDELEHLRGPARTALVVQVRQPEPHRSGVRRQAVEHNLECLELGTKLGARSHTVWIGDGGNFPGQSHCGKRLDRYLDSMREIYAALPHGLAPVHRAQALRAGLLLDGGQRLGHELLLRPGAGRARVLSCGSRAPRPNVNIEMIVARLIQFGKLGGFHFNDSKYGDDDLDSGSIKPFQLFLIFNELVDAELSRVPGFDPAYMLDQSHNVTDPVESLMTSAAELVRAYVQAHLVDRARLPSTRNATTPCSRWKRSRKPSAPTWSPFSPWRGSGRGRHRPRGHFPGERLPAARGPRLDPPSPAWERGSSRTPNRTASRRRPDRPRDVSGSETRSLQVSSPPVTSPRTDPPPHRATVRCATSSSTACAAADYSPP